MNSAAPAHAPFRAAPYVGGLLVLLATSVAAPHAASAQSIPVALSPTRFEFGAYPGQELKGTIEFWNGAEAQLPIQIQTADFTPNDEDGHVIVTDDAETTRSLKDWITPEFSEITVFPKVKIRTDFTINIPERAEPGTHWGTILVQSLPTPAGDGSAVQVKLGTLILLTVYGETKEVLRVESVFAPHFSDSPPIPFIIRFRNEGSVHLKPEGTIEVKNIFGKTVARTVLPERNVLRDNIRRSDVELGERDLWFGRYSAMLNATYGTGNQPLNAQTTFWVIPWKSQGPTLLIWVVLAAFVIAKRKNFKAAFRALGTDPEAAPRHPSTERRPKDTLEP